MVKVGFSTHTYNPLSALIRLFTKSKVSHCWLLIEDPFFGVPLVLEATEVGFRLTAYSDFKSSTNVICLVEPSIPLDAGVHKAWPWLGEAYDFGGLFGMALVMIGRWLKRKWNNPFASSGAMFCSEAIMKILQAENFPGASAFEAETTEPQDLLDFLVRAGGTVSTT